MTTPTGDRDTAGQPIRQLDPRKPNIVTVIGRKGTGKSILAAAYWASYPYDRVCIDPTRDALVGTDVRTVHELPGRVPRPDTDAGETRTSLVFQPDPGDPAYYDELDRAVGLALNNPRRRTLLWVDERGEISSAGKTGPFTRRALAMSRHFGLSILSCGPRAVGMDPLLIGNADYLYLFDMPTVHDRRRVAETIGVELADLSGAIAALPPHAYLRWSAAERDMVQFDPLPKSLVSALRRGTPTFDPADEQVA